MSLPEALLQRLDFETAVKVELATTNRLMPRRWDRLALVAHASEIAKWLKAQYRRDKMEPPASILFVDKNRKGTRPISELSIRDRVLYRSLVTLIAQSLPDELVRRPPIESFRHAPLDVPNVRYISKTDVAAYYEFIDHELLHDELLAQTGEALAIDALMDLLERMMGRRVGLPQVHKASDILGDTYIDPAKRRLRRAGYEVYTFSDDFRIASGSLAGARSALEACAAEVRLLGLVLNESKTYTYAVDNYQASLTAFADAEAKLFDEETALRDLRLLVESDYSDDDDDEDGEDEDAEPGFALSDTEIEDITDSDAIVEMNGTEERQAEVDRAQLRAARRAWEIWMDEDESEETQSSRTAAVTEALLSRSLPILGAGGDRHPLEYLSLVLRYEPALTPQTAKYIVGLAGNGKSARRLVRTRLDALCREDNFSTWQKMWLADAAGNVVRGDSDHAHYEWLVECVRVGAPALAATAAAALGKLGLSETDVVVGALDRVGPSWRPLMLWGLALMDEDQAEANREDRVDQLLIEATRTWRQPG
ncbi:hypothetical protein GCM10009817_30820 [Terrabacter lapilli]|uniref:Reverse transcriptase domain-containing protein n=1 Tax=Terrabacter lapilli TaxID=436231 RepID=A0ABN2SIE0_9MICO